MLMATMGRGVVWAELTECNMMEGAKFSLSSSVELSSEEESASMSGEG